MYTVLVCVVGGCRPDLIRAARTPTLDRLITEGAWSMEARTVSPSLGLPAQQSLLVGVDVPKHGVSNNDVRGVARPVPSLLDLMARMRRPSGAFFNWGPLRETYAPESPTVAIAMASANEDDADTALAEMAAESLIKTPCDLVYLSLDGVHCAGVRYGWGSERQLATVSRADEALSIVLDALEDSGRQVTSLIVGDHGGHEYACGTALKEDMTVPFLLHGLGVKPGPMNGPVSVLDAAPTLARFLDIPAERGWDGRVVSQAVAA